MPKIVVPEVGAASMTYWLLNPSLIPFPTLSLCQFVNDIEPDWDTVAGDFVEASYDGYERKTVEPGMWDVAIGDDPPIVGTYQEQFTWTAGTDSGTVYGYYLLWESESQAIWCQRFDVPITLEDGLVIKIRPKLSLWSRCIPVCSESEGG